MTIVLLTGLMPIKTKRILAQTVLSCNLTSDRQTNINTAIANYLTNKQTNNTGTVVSNQLKTDLQANSNQKIEVINQGIENEAGELISALGIIADSLIDLYQQQGLSEPEADMATIATISQWATLPVSASSVELVAAIKESLIKELGTEKTELIEQIDDGQLLTTLAGLQPSALAALALSPSEIEAASTETITPQAEASFLSQTQSATQAAADKITPPAAKEKIIEVQTKSESELEDIRQGNQKTLDPGSQLRFKFRLNNPGQQGITIELPNIQTITDNALTGGGQVTGVVYGLATGEPQNQQTITDVAQNVSIPGGQTLNLEIQVEVTEIAIDSLTSFGIDLETNCGDRNLVQAVRVLQLVQGVSVLPIIDPEEENDLIDPRGQISGCAGELLADYQGLSVGLYDLNPNDPTESEPSHLTPLTATELPNDPDNNIPAGIEPNIENSNPFFLTNSDEGKYSFLFDEDTDQLDFGRNYILLVDPGVDSVYDQRLVKITIGDRQDRIVEYTATSLDGRPISAVDNQTTVTGEIILVEDAERVSLNLAVLDLSTNICDAQEVSITKTGDRATAEPGDIIVYRLAIRNLASAPLTNFDIADTLPIGFGLQEDSVRAQAGSEIIPVTTTQNDNRLVNFTVDTTLPTGEVLNIIYATEVTADALRGSGDNSAIVNAERLDNQFVVRDGPAVHNLDLEAGIIQNSGTLLGRVFVDKNFDGEQQKGEPGVPNAVIYLEDGNRIITDADGLFSVTNVLPGYHTGILDLTTIPEYGLAPNLRFSERNSKSRLVNLEPGGTVRMNFAVTPTAEGKEDKSKPEISDPATETDNFDQ